MNLEDYRTIFAAGSFILILIVASPTLDLIMPYPRGQEKFSEVWVLGPNHMAKDYPFNVRVNESYKVYVRVGNHMGGSSYYMVSVKFRNQTQPPPNATLSEPSPLVPLFEYQIFVANGKTWEAPITFSVWEASRNGDSVFVARIFINDVVFSVNTSAKWDLESKGFYYQLLFELWLYNKTSRSFQFHNRFVGIWLNMSG